MTRRFLLVLILLGPVLPATSQPIVLATGGSGSEHEDVIQTRRQPNPGDRLADVIHQFDALIRGGSRTSVDPGKPAELDNASAIEYTPDGTRLVAIGATTGNLVIQDSRTGAFMHEVQVGPGPFGLAVTDSIAVVALASGEAVIVDLFAASVLRRVQLPGEPVIARVTADGAKALIGSNASQTCTVLDVATGGITVQFSCPVFITGSIEYVRAARFRVDFTPLDLTPDGVHIVAAGNGTFQVYDVERGLLRILRYLPGVAHVMDITPDSRTVAVAGGGAFKEPVFAHLIGLDVADLNILPWNASDQIVPSGIAVRDDGTGAVVSLTGQVYALEIGAPSRLLSARGSVLPLGHNRAVVLGGSYTIYDLSTTTQYASGDAPPSATLVTALGDGERFTAVSYLETAAPREAGDADLGRRIPLGQAPEADAPRTLALSPDGRSIAVALHFNDGVAISSALSGEVEVRLESDVPSPSALAFTPDGSRLIVGGLGGAVLLDIASGEVLTRAFIPGSRIRTIHVTPDGSRVLLHDSIQGGVVVLGMEGNEWSLLRTAIVGGQVSGLLAYDNVPFAAFSTDGRFAATLSTPSQVDIFDTKTEQVTEFDLDSSPRDLAFSDDGTRLLVTQQQGRVTLIDLTGTPRILARETLSSEITRVAFNSQTGVFAVANVATQPVQLIDVDANTAQALVRRTIRAPIYITLLDVTPEGQAVVAGMNTENGGGVIASTSGWTSLSGVPADVVLSDATGVGIASVPGPDRLETLKGFDVAQEPLAATGTFDVRTFPSPTRGATTVHLRLTAPAEVHLTVFDALGRQVASRSEALGTGDQSMRWDGRNVSGRAVPSGTYLMRLQAGDQWGIARVVVAR